MLDGLGAVDDIGNGGLPLRADINVTSLVDVAFVMLIIFMITAPIMQGGVDIDLPKAEARPLAANEGMVITVEPAVYLPKKFGIRIEDMVLVTKKGCKVLSADIH